MKKAANRPQLLAELTKRKMEAQKAGGGETSEFFGKFKPSKGRNVNTSTVGPSWGPRKGN